MWFIGALLGGLLFGVMWSEAWLLGALIGGVGGVLLNRWRSDGSPDQPDRLLKVEQQLSVLADELRQVRQRLAALEPDEATHDQATPAPVTAPAPETPATAPTVSQDEPAPP
jgi:hypothetical protein